MEAPATSDLPTTPVQISLRIRHPDIDPGIITATLNLQPEYAFKAGDPRTKTSPALDAGHHPQTYWLAPVDADALPDLFEPTFLATIAAKRHGLDAIPTAANWHAVIRNLRAVSTDTVLLHFLRRLDTQRPFLDRIVAGGGDVALILLMERDSIADFTLPLAASRLLTQLAVAIEFKFV